MSLRCNVNDLVSMLNWHLKDVYHSLTADAFQMKWSLTDILQTYVCYLLGLWGLSRLSTIHPSILFIHSL